MLEIISFGSEIEPLSADKKGFVYSDKTLKELKIKISKFSSDMGGTDIMKPLTSAFSHPCDKGYAKKIFLLTDGEVQNASEVIELTKKFSSHAQVHTFGIGNDCSKHLVRGVAKAGRGSFSVVEETKDLKARVISAL